MIDQKQLQNVKYLNFLGSMINYARCTPEMKFRIVMAKASFNRNKTFHKKIGLKFNEETSEVLHVEHSFVRC
jgi:hypothetical protein